MKYKVGDKVKIKSLEWYEDNKDENGNISCNDLYFVPEMSELCGTVCEIVHILGSPFVIEYYQMKNNTNWSFNDDMIECCVAEAEQPNTTEEEKLSELVTEAKELITKLNNAVSKHEKQETKVTAKETKVDRRPVMERVKTFEDACEELRENDPRVMAYNSFKDSTMNFIGYEYVSDIEAYLQLRIIVAALNEGWEAKFNMGEFNFIPLFWLYSQRELDGMPYEMYKNTPMVMIDDNSFDTDYTAFVYCGTNYDTMSSDDNVGTNLYLKSNELAEYCGKQFIKIWANYFLKNKKG